MVINSGKTKEMIMGRIDVSDLPPICTQTGQIERVHSFKLLGVYAVSYTHLTLPTIYSV